MGQMALFSVAGLRDRTRARNYSPSRDDFRRDHERRRHFGLQRRHAEKLRRLNLDAPGTFEDRAAKIREKWSDPASSGSAPSSGSASLGSASPGSTPSRSTPSQSTPSQSTPPQSTPPQSTPPRSTLPEPVAARSKSSGPVGVRSAELWPVVPRSHGARSTEPDPVATWPASPQLATNRSVGRPARIPSGPSGVPAAVRSAYRQGPAMSHQPCSRLLCHATSRPAVTPPPGSLVSWSQRTSQSSDFLGLSTTASLPTTRGCPASVLPPAVSVSSISRQLAVPRPPAVSRPPAVPRLVAVPNLPVASRQLAAPCLLAAISGVSPAQLRRLSVFATESRYRKYIALRPAAAKCSYHAILRICAGRAPPVLRF